jgi:hypothetical protein
VIDETTDPAEPVTITLTISRGLFELLEWQAEQDGVTVEEHAAVIVQAGTHTLAMQSRPNRQDRRAIAKGRKRR